jgi:hypothetical protein
MKCRRPSMLFLLFTLAATLLLVAGCHPRSRASRSVLSTTVQGRDIVATIEGPGSVSPRENSATVQFAGKRLVIEKERILLDGTVKVTVPADTRKIEVEFIGGKLTIAADGKELFKGSL